MGANVQVCWEKFCPLLGRRAAPGAGAPSRTHLTAEEAVEHCDENTIGVVAILGSTFDGCYEPVAEIGAALDRLAAGGGPTCRCTSMPPPAGSWRRSAIRTWCGTSSFRGASINASGHKYGLVYPGVGWVVWRDKAALPAELIFSVDYLGGNMPTFALNFSRAGRAGGRPVLHAAPARPRGVPAGAAVLPGHRPMARRRGEQTGPLRAGLGRQRHPGVRVPAAPGGRPATPCSHVRAAAHAWLDRARLPDPGRSTTSRCCESRPQRLLRDLAALLLDDLGHVLTRVQGLAGHLPEPDVAKRAAFHH